MAIMCPHDLTSDTSHAPFVSSASSFFSGTNSNPWKAFNSEFTQGNGALANTWLGTGSGTDWLQLDTGGAFILASYAIATNTSTDFTDEQARAPKNWTVQGSNDAITWTTLDTQTNQTAWTSGGQIRQYVIGSPGVTAFRYFRINITANNGDTTFTQISELYLFAPLDPGELAPHDLAWALDPSGAVVYGAIHPPFIITASSFFSTTGDPSGPWRAFDGDSTTEWLGNNGGTDWLKSDLGAAVILGSYAIETGILPGRAPKDWTMEGSNDNATWDTLDTRAGETLWTAGTAGKRTYGCVTFSTAYRWFRLNITANNGDTAHTSVAEMHLLTAIILPPTRPAVVFVVT